MTDLGGRRLLVTGAGGFIGGRLVERLVLLGARDVRVLVRRVASAAGLARFPVEILTGDVTDPAALAAAVEGCDTVFHCAYGTSGSQRQRAFVNRQGTRRLLEAAAGAGARRMVHLSTLMVYGRTPDGDLDERAPRRRFGNAYADSKLDAERAVLDGSRSGGLEAVVLQPTAVYGPYGGVWTERLLVQLRGARAILVDGGAGLCNHVYVDDLVQAMLLAAVAEGVAGEAFLVSAAEPVTWREFYARFERLLGGERTVEMSAAAALAHWREARRRRPRLLGEAARALRERPDLRERVMETREIRALRELASAVLPESWQQRIKRRLASGGGAAAADAAAPLLPIHSLHQIMPLSPSEIGFFAARTRVRIDKARRLLGYSPAFDLDSGMALTAAWAKWAGLLDG
jgi:nucleoside-diphosphate-sugar epimerase